jgi:hypothetical protein
MDKFMQAAIEEAKLGHEEGGLPIGERFKTFSKIRNAG